MKRLLTILMLLILVASFGCDTRQPVTQLEVGREKLLGAGLAIEAIEHLKRAEVKEAKTEIQKVEPRALLLVAYSYALSTGDAQSHGVADEYAREKNKRLTSLSDVEIKKILDLLNERHRTQQATIQLLVDKGPPVIPLLIKRLGDRWYANSHEDLIEILYQIGPKGLDQITAALNDSNTPLSVKVTLVRLIARMNDRRVIPALEAMRSNTDAGLKMEINIALYQLGKKEYRPEIIAGLSDNNVAVRRAVSKALSAINDSPTDKILNALDDVDAQVRMHLVQALTKYPTQRAINPLIEMLKTEADEEVKQAVTQALIVHGQQEFGKNLARRLVKELPHVTEPNDRLRIAHILITKALQKQIKTAPKDDRKELEYQLYQEMEKEQNEMVKGGLSRLLFALEH